MDKWGGQLKNDKTKNSRFYDLRFVGIKITKQKFRVLKNCLAY